MLFQDGINFNIARVTVGINFSDRVGKIAWLDNVCHMSLKLQWKIFDTVFMKKYLIGKIGNDFFWVF